MQTRSCWLPQVSHAQCFSPLDITAPNPTKKFSDTANHSITNFLVYSVCTVDDIVNKTKGVHVHAYEKKFLKKTMLSRDVEKRTETSW